MLWRALKHVKNGLYVDIGAQHPVVDSVSKAFYEHGWRGIHIEPVPVYAELLRKDRPDETVLQVALADADGMLELNVIPDTGLSTAVDAYAQIHQVERGYELHRIQVPVLTLKTATKSLIGKDVHWLKIDVEGFEEKVLKGWDAKTLRPWIMVVEATIPNLSKNDYESWDPILVEADYQFVYFDGLNRFYVAKEHAELAEAFSSPPNVFDKMELTRNSILCHGLMVSYQASEKELTAQAEELAIQLNAASEYNAQLQTHSEWLQNEWVAAKQRIEEISKNTGQLEAELAVERQKVGSLASELNAANEHNTQLQAHAQWLQNELDAANSKINELNQLSHHWWTVADRLSQEQQSIYASKFWRITWPLRKIMQITKWSLILPVRSMRWGARLAKGMIKPLVIWAMRKTLDNPRIRNRTLSVLTEYPQLKQHLRLLAMRSGLIPGIATSRTGHSSGVNADSQSAVETMYSSNMQEKPLNNLSPRAIRIYTKLKKSIDVRKS